MSASPSSSAKEAKKALGARMREVRKDAGLTARALALRTKQHYTRVSKIENGTQVPTDIDIRLWCAACKADDQVVDLIATARAVESAYVEFRRQARAGMKRVLGPHTQERYATTATFRIYEHNAIPGLFQTGAYCEAMLSFWMDFLDTSDRLETAVSERMRKQEVLSWPGKKFTVVLEEQALRTWFGTAEVHAGQLGRLLEVMALPSVSLGIIPMMTERAGVASAPFWIFDDTLVALETPSASIEVTRSDEITIYTRMFGHLEAAALHGPDARALIVKALDEMS
jgi:transcriptional regulator with XRE-family HTH domain